jgi:hypothetical protein
MLEEFATCAPVTRFLTVQEMCHLRIGCNSRLTGFPNKWVLVRTLPVFRYQKCGL